MRPADFDPDRNPPPTPEARMRGADPDQFEDWPGRGTPDDAPTGNAVAAAMFALSGAAVGAATMWGWIAIAGCR